MMSLLQSKSKAFTMIELIFVIIILGIVASIGSQIIVNVYSSYILERAQHRASAKTELAALQIANRLSSAIPGTVYRINKASGAFEPISDGFSPDQNYTGIQWVGSDTDSFSATLTPGWSGFCDINDSNASSISSPGSDVTLIDPIIQNLSASKDITDAKLYFYNGSSKPHSITSAAGNTFTINSMISGDILSERYKVAWTSYALIVDNNGDLYLHYDFPATPKASRTSAKTSLIMHNVATFKFKGAGRSIRFKICKEEEIGEDFNVTACKEKAVF